MATGEWEKLFRDSRRDDLMKWRCHYCSDVATTMRQGAAVCAFHANVLRNVGWA
jgi:hypothetical protein